MAGKTKYIDAPVRNVKDRIVRYKTVGDIILTSDEELILLRWEYCDQLMRTHHTYTQVCDAIREKFGVSRHTADKDWAATQDVFAKSRSLNKKYEGALHLDRLKKMINFYESKIYELDEEGKPLVRDKQLKDIGAVLAKLYDSYTYQLNSIPSDTVNGKTIVPTMIMRMVNNNYYTPPMSAADALKAAANYIDYDDITDGAGSDGTGTDHDESGNAIAPLPDQAG